MEAYVPIVGLWEPVRLPNQSPSADGGCKLSVSDEHPTLMYIYACTMKCVKH